MNFDLQMTYFVNVVFFFIILVWGKDVSNSIACPATLAEPNLLPNGKKTITAVD